LILVKGPGSYIQYILASIIVWLFYSFYV